MRNATRWAVLCLLALALLAGCAPGAPSATPEVATSTVTTISATASAMPITPPATAAALPEPIPNDAGLAIEENEIVGKVEIEPLKFLPKMGTQAAVMLRHAGEKLAYPALSTTGYESTGPVMIWKTTSGEYKVRQILPKGNEPATTSIEVSKDGEVIFQTDAGEISPLSTLQRFWVEDGHWTLEINRVANRREGNSVYSDTTGEIYRDGALLNETYGYEEMFNFQMMGGKPFYFYRQDGKVRASYNGRTLPVEYDDIPHYGCCSSATLNPEGGANWVGFFAQRGNTWYYTEIGLY